MFFYLFKFLADTTTSDYSNGDSLEIRQDLISNCYANSSKQIDKNQENQKDNDKNIQQTTSGHFLLKKKHSLSQRHNKHDEKEKPTIRRVASFTFSPENSSVKHNKHHDFVTIANSQSGPSISSMHRKFTL